METNNEMTIHIKNLLNNMSGSAVETKKYVEELNSILDMSDSTKISEKLNELISELKKENEYFVLTNMIPYAKSLLNIDISTSYDKVLTLLEDINNLDYIVREKHEDKVKEVFEVIYKLMKKEINERETYYIFNRVRKDIVSEHYINSCILNEINSLYSYNAKPIGFDELDLMIKEMKTKSNEVMYVKREIINKIIFITMSDEKRVKYTSVVKRLNEEMPKAADKLVPSEKEDKNIKEYKEEIKKQKENLAKNKKDIRPRLISAILSHAILLGSAGFFLKSGYDSIGNKVVVSTTTERFFTDGTKLSPVKEYKPIREQEETRYLEVYKEINPNITNKYNNIAKYTYNVSDINFDTTDSYLSMDPVEYDLEATDVDYMTDNVENFKGKKMLIIETQNKDDIVIEKDEDFNDEYAKYATIYLVLLACLYIASSFTSSLGAGLLKNLFNLYGEKESYNRKLNNSLVLLKGLLYKYEDSIKLSKELMNEYYELFHGNGDKYVDEALLEETKEYVKTLEMRNKYLQIEE